jgi:hypothetical protein
MTTLAGKKFLIVGSGYVGGYVARGLVHHQAIVSCLSRYSIILILGQDPKNKPLKIIISIGLLAVLWKQRNIRKQLTMQMLFFILLGPLLIHLLPNSERKDNQEHINK